MSHKHRGASKIKLCHEMIKGLRNILESIENWPEIKSIIPAKIHPCNDPKSRITLKIQYQTRSGLKCLAYSGAQVQEVFFVTAEPEKLRERLECP